MTKHRQLRPNSRLWVAVAALMIVSAACGSSSATTTTAAQSGATTTTQGGGETTTTGGGGGTDDAPVAGIVNRDWTGHTITFVGYGGEFQAAQEEGWARPFEEQTGITVLSETGESAAKLIAMQEAGDVTWDVVYGSTTEDHWTKCGTDEAIAASIDYSLVDVSDTNPDWVHECFLPVSLETEQILYSTERFGDDPPTSFADFFDTEKYPGKRGIPGTSYPPALFMAELARYVSGEANVRPYPYDEMFALLDGLGDDLAFWTSYPEITQMIEAGEVAMAWGTGGRAHVAVRNGAQYAPLWNDCNYVTAGLYIPVGTKNWEAAHDFLNMAMSAEGQAIVTERLVYGGTNLNSQPNVDEILAPFILTPERAEICWFLDRAEMYVDYSLSGERWLDWLNS